MTGRLALRGEVVFTPEPQYASEGRLLEVRVEGGRVQEIADVATGDAPPDGSELLGGLGRWVMPGFVNLHTHLAMTLMRGVGEDLTLQRWLEDEIWPRERRLNSDDVYWGSLLGLAEGLAAGITWFSDMYMDEDQVAEAVLISGARADLATGLVGEGAAFDQALAKAVAIARAYDGAGSGRVRMRLGPHAPYTCPMDSLKKVAQAAGASGLGVHIHLSETKSEVEEALAREGRTPVGVAAAAGLFESPVVAAHVVHPQRTDLPLLAAMAGGVAHCPGSNLQLGSGIAPTVRMAEAGVTIGLGTDGAASSPGLNPWTVVKLAWLLPKGATYDPSHPTAGESLRWATEGGATALGRPDLGRIKALAPADLVLVRHAGVAHRPMAGGAGAALLATTDRSDVEATVVAGRVLYQNGHYTTLDVERIVAECEKRSGRIAGALADGRSRTAENRHPIT